MATAGSQDLRLFRRAIRDGATLDEACAAAGTVESEGRTILMISHEEGRLILARDAKDPPGPECFELLYDPTAKAAAVQPKEAAMPAAAKKEDGEGAGISGEYKRPDAAGALKIYRDEIAPKNAHMATIKGDLSDPYKRIKDTCHFPRKVLDFLMQLDDMEEAKRDHWLLAFHSGLTELKLHLPSDLVTMAQGKSGGDVIPFGDRRRPQMATMPSDGSETDLAEAGEDLLGEPISAETIAAAGADDFTEATEEEFAAQEGRSGSNDDDEEQAEAAE